VASQCPSNSAEWVYMVITLVAEMAGTGQAARKMARANQRLKLPHRTHTYANRRRRNHHFGVTGRRSCCKDCGHGSAGFRRPTSQYLGSRTVTTTGTLRRKRYCVPRGVAFCVRHGSQGAATDRLGAGGRGAGTDGGRRASLRAASRERPHSLRARRPRQDCLRRELEDMTNMRPIPALQRRRRAIVVAIGAPRSRRR
jgi:hypothetical protein